MGSGASIHVEPYLDNDTASLSDESMDDISMDTAFMTDESDSENESFLSNVLSTFTKVLGYSEGKEVSKKSSLSC